VPADSSYRGLGSELPNLLDRNSWSETDPTGDVRVRWLLNELNDICSSLALGNLCRDLIRERQGGKRKRPHVPIDGTELENEKAMQHEPIQAARLQDCDLRLAWKGLLAWRQSECNSADDDVLAVLTVLAEHPEIESGFSSQWPIKEIVRLLNARDGQPVWTQRKVDNAKEKLGRWITKKKQGLDDYEDFEALLVRIGRKLEDKERSADGAWPDGRQIRSGGRQ
jgi:hypothetical protein